MRGNLYKVKANQCSYHKSYVSGGSVDCCSEILHGLIGLIKILQVKMKLLPPVVKKIYSKGTFDPNERLRQETKITVCYIWLDFALVFEVMTCFFAHFCGTGVV